MNTKNSVNCITDLDIQALIDGETEGKQRDQLLAAIMRKPALYDRYMLYKKQKDLLKSWWKDN